MRSLATRIALEFGVAAVIATLTIAAVHTKLRGRSE